MGSIYVVVIIIIIIMHPTRCSVLADSLKDIGLVSWFRVGFASHRKNASIAGADRRVRTFPGLNLHGPVKVTFLQPPAPSIWLASKKFTLRYMYVHV